MVGLNFTWLALQASKSSLKNFSICTYNSDRHGMGGCNFCKSYIIDSLEMILSHSFSRRREQVRNAAPDLHFYVMTDMEHYYKTLPVKYKKRVSKLESIVKTAGKVAAVDYLFDKDYRIRGLFNICLGHLWGHGVGKLADLEHVLHNTLFDLFIMLYEIHQGHLVAAGVPTTPPAPKTLSECLVDDEHFLDF